MLSQKRLAIACAPVLALSITIAVVLAQTPKPGFADAVLGRWDLTIRGPEGPYPSWLEVHLRKESQIQARFVGRSGSVRYATTADYRDGQLTVVMPVQYEENLTDLRFVGKLVGDKLEGTTKGEEGNTLAWTGVRAPAHSPERTVTWGTPITLFNGTDTSGWRLRTGAAPACWSAVDGTLTNSKKCNDIVSERSFKDFKLHIEFMYPAGSNSGVYLRGRYEVQIDDSGGKALDALRLGGVYGFLRPYVDASRPAGQWQAYDITLVGSRVTVVLNARTIIDNEVIPGITGGALDSNEAEPGPLMLQGDHGKVSFRNIVVTPGQ
jgi:hypothetical protein